MDVWATGSIDLAAWNKSFLAHTSFVAVDGETIAGFGDIDSSGYLDRLYVHKDHQGIGIATALCEKLEASVESATVTTHASITARPFFEHRGYVVKKEQQVERQGILLTNYVMEKQQKNTTSQRVLSNGSKINVGVDDFKIDHLSQYFSFIIKRKKPPSASRQTNH